MSRYAILRMWISLFHTPPERSPEASSRVATSILENRTLTFGEKMSQVKLVTPTIVDELTAIQS